MKKNRNFFIIILLLVQFSCETFQRSDLTDFRKKKFYLTKFTYFNGGINRKQAYGFMKDINLWKILAVLSHKYNINIDYSDFDIFLLSGSDSEIRVEGLIKDDEYIWEYKGKRPLSVEFEYHVAVNPATSDDEYKYKLIFKKGGKRIEGFYGDIFDKNDLLAVIASAAGFKVMPQERTYFVDDQGKRIKFHRIPLNKDETVKLDRAMMERKIKDDISNYMRKLSEQEKKEFRDNLINFIYTKTK